MKKSFIILAVLSIPLLLEAEVTTQPTPTPPAPQAPVRSYIARFNKNLKPAKLLPYKTIGDTTLNLHLFTPKNASAKATDKRPCLLAIHGGGWGGGNPASMYVYCQWATDNGMVAVSAQYRLYKAKEPKSPVTDCVRDIRSAVRYLKQNAAGLGIDPDRIITIGASAGGHLALAPAMFKYDNPGDDLSIHTGIAAMILLSPVIDTSLEGYGNLKVRPDWKSLSPRHNVTPNLPPTLLLHGTADKTTPYLGAEIFAKEMKDAGNNITFITRQNGIHTYMGKSEKDYHDSMQQITAFLKSLNLLPGGSKN